MTTDVGNGNATNLQHPPKTRPRVATHSVICARDNYQRR